MLKGNETLTLTDGTVYTVALSERFGTASVQLLWNVLNYVEGPPLLIQSLVDDAVKGGADLVEGTEQHRPAQINDESYAKDYMHG